MADEIVFKCEDSMWRMMAEEDVTGSLAKPFDMRRYDWTDERIYKLSWGHKSPKGWDPDVDDVSFVNNATGAVLTRRYLGMEFADWAPGWCFLLVGERVSR